MPSPSLSDGILSSGSFEATILETAVPYILDNFSWDPATTLLRTKTASGRGGRQKTILSFIDGTADAQLAEPTTPLPKENMAFAVDADNDGVVEPYFVEKAGPTFSQDNETKSKWTIHRFVNPCLYCSGGKTTDQIYAGITSASTVAITAINFAAYLPPDLTLSATPWTASGLPAGVVISASTGAITGTPTTPGINYVQIKCTATRSWVSNGVLKTETLVGKREFVWTIS